jgi:hypothetical protein
LANADVELIPEDCFAGAIQSARGKTNRKGVAKPVTVDAPPGLPGVQFGLYRVRISHAEREIPSQYNQSTTLGCELSPLERDGDQAEFRIRSPK